MKCKYIDRPRHIFPCSVCKNKHCDDPIGHGYGNIPTTCDDCRYQFDKERTNGKKGNGCKRGLRPCKDFEQW